MRDRCLKQWTYNEVLNIAGTVSLLVQFSLFSQQPCFYSCKSTRNYCLCSNINIGINEKIHQTAEQIRLLFIHSIIKIICFYKLILSSNVLKLFKRNTVTLKSTWIIYVEPNNSTFVKRKLQASLRNLTWYLILCLMTKSDPQQHREDGPSCVISLQTCTEYAVLGLKPFYRQMSQSYRSKK